MSNNPASSRAARVSLKRVTRSLSVRWKASPIDPQMTGCMPVLARSTTCFLKVAISKPSSHPVSFGKFVNYRQYYLPSSSLPSKKVGIGAQTPGLSTLLWVAPLPLRRLLSDDIIDFSSYTSNEDMHRGKVAGTYLSWAFYRDEGCRKQPPALHLITGPMRHRTETGP